ncbi:MAG: PIN domain-containing protein [Dissulfuribacterales bacterium]
MKRCTLDTNIITAFMKNDSAVVRKISDYLEVFDALTINIISYYEILRGLKDLGKADKLRKFEEFMQENELISIRKETVQKAAEIYAYLKKGGNFDRRRRHFNSLYCSCRRFNSCH